MSIPARKSCPRSFFSLIDNSLTGISHGRVKTGGEYGEATARSHRTQPGQAA
jgi:hypothetical protein